MSPPDTDISIEFHKKPPLLPTPNISTLDTNISPAPIQPPPAEEHKSPDSYDEHYPPGYTPSQYEKNFWSAWDRHQSESSLYRDTTFADPEMQLRQHIWQETDRELRQERDYWLMQHDGFQQEQPTRPHPTINTLDEHLQPQKDIQRQYINQVDFLTQDEIEEALGPEFDELPESHKDPWFTRLGLTKTHFWGPANTWTRLTPQALANLYTESPIDYHGYFHDMGVTAALKLREPRRSQKLKELDLRMLESVWKDPHVKNWEKFATSFWIDTPWGSKIYYKTLGNQLRDELYHHRHDDEL